MFFTRVEQRYVCFLQEKCNYFKHFQLKTVFLLCATPGVFFLPILVDLLKYEPIMKPMYAAVFQTVCAEGEN